MTELQLRLWCLWMCEEFAESDFYGLWATEGADEAMSAAVWALLGEIGPLGAWKLSERMP